jgi:hypothetical protein
MKTGDIKAPSYAGFTPAGSIRPLKSIIPD